MKKKTPVWRLIIAALVYGLLFMLGAVSGLIHPMCFAYAGTFLPLLMGFVYLYTASKMQCFGAATLLNGLVLIPSAIAGEADLTFAVGAVSLTVIAEVVRLIVGYNTLKGVRLSFIALAFSYYSYVFHWWTDTSGSIAAAVEEMPAGYADKVQGVIDNVPVLIVMLILTVPMALIGMKLAEKAMKKQAAALK